MADLPANDLSGRYRILRSLGVGGMARVDLAADLRLGRYVALKRIRRDIMTPVDLVERFRREAHAVARLGHPHVVAIFDLVQDHHDEVLVMEWLEGGSLEDLIVRNGPVAHEVAAALVIQASEGLHAAHLAGIVHRDVKPANLLLGRDGRLRVADFGIARLADAIRRTRTGELPGSPGTMAPEVIRGEPATPASDAFALGAVFHWLLRGVLPWEAESVHALLWRIVEGPTPRLLETLPEVKPELADLVDALLDRDPTARPSLPVLADRLRSFCLGASLRDLAAPARALLGDLPPPLPLPAPLAASDSLSPGLPVVINSRGNKTRRYAALFGGLVLLAAALIFLRSCMTSRPDASTRQAFTPLAMTNGPTVGSAPESGWTDSVELEGYDEGFHEINVVKPRLFVRNASGRVLTHLRTSISIRSPVGRQIVVKTWYAPGCTAIVRSTDNRGGHAVDLECATGTWPPGGWWPDGGMAIGLHHTDWSDWDRSDDRGLAGLGPLRTPLTGMKIQAR